MHQAWSILLTGCTVSTLLTHACPLQAAASAFNILFKSGGGSAVESVIPTLLSGLEGDDEQAAQALEGLRVILGVRPQTLGSMVRSMLCPMLIEHSTAS